jgi:ATP-dependent RNA helicase DDX51/DBP6
MFSVERFGVGPSAAGGGAGGGGGGGEERGDKRVSALLQKSQERLKKKDLEAEQAKKVTLLRQKAANNAKKNIAKAELKSSNGKRKLEPRVMETEEDRKKRKAEAKQAKKERKAKQRMDPEAEPNTEVNNEDDDEEDEVESSERSAQNHDNKKASDDEEVDEEEDETEIPEAQSSKSTVFASILQQLDPNRTKKESKIVNIPTKAAQLSAKLGDAPDANQVGSEGPMDVAIEDKDDKVDTVDVSNQYSLEDNSTPEVFVPVSVQESVKEWGVDPKLAETLIDDGINTFFPVQTAVLPLLLNSAKRPYLQPRDICVSAPTGSGKTLSYALPIIQTLRSRKVTRLRALVMLPSRELASQVSIINCQML